MIQTHNICLAFGNQTIFDDIGFTIDQDDRIGLVGRNGSGKSTMLKAIVDPSVLDSGSSTVISSKKLAYMPQEVVLLSTLSVIDETCTAFAALHALQQESLALEALIAVENPDQKKIDRYALVQEQLANFAPEALRAKAKKMLMGLGFTLEQLEQSVETLSVGWKMRIVLAKLLLQEADFYLFDEPTNHLDLGAKEWFLDFLKQASFGFMIVCHERYFLDELCTSILELERGQGNWYTGNYSAYLVQKEHNLKLLETAYIQQQKDIKRKKETIERFKASASRAKMAQSMMKALDKIDVIEMPPSQRVVHFSFPPVQQAGRIVMTVANVAQKFGDKQIFSNASFEVERGQKVALIAPNGAGKTTLFNIITGSLPLQKGTITFGYNVSHAIFAQDQNKSLNMKLSVLENISQLCPKSTEQTMRSFLGAFLFSNTDVNKKVQVLSGGEKNRVGMVSVLLQQANLLLLDEPTNHLDIPSKEVLLRALQEFSGTILFVSHDRDFINALATHTLELTPEGTFMYHGNYDSYLNQKKDIDAAQGVNNKTSSQHGSSDTESKTSTFEISKKSKRLEEKIAKLEQHIELVQASFADFEYGTPQFSGAQVKLKTLQTELREAEQQWEQLQKELLAA